MLWDLIHDRTHSHGDLPFDPFMIKQRMPFWMYALEELRCDLTAFREAVELEAEGVPVRPAACSTRSSSTGCSASRSPATGCATTTASAASCSSPTCTSTTRCAGPTTRCTIDWDACTEVTDQLCAEIETLYRDGIDRPKLAHWFAAYELVAATSQPHPGSRLGQGRRRAAARRPPRKARRRRASGRVPAEHVLRGAAQKLGDVIASTKGITGLTGLAAHDAARPI